MNKIALTLLLASCLMVGGCTTTTTTTTRHSLPGQEEGSPQAPSSPEATTTDSDSTSTVTVTVDTDRIQQKGDIIRNGVSKTVDKAADSLQNAGDEIRYQFEKNMNQVDTELRNLPPEEAQTEKRSETRINIKSDNSGLHYFKQRQTELSNRFYELERGIDHPSPEARLEWQQISRNIQELLKDIRAQQTPVKTAALQEESPS